MNVSTMRRVDRWVGVPLCFVLTIWRRLADAISPRRGQSAPKNILFVQTVEMGSLVLAMPAVRYIRERYPRSRIYFVVFSSLRESVSAIGLVPDDHVLTIDPSNLATLARDTWRFMRAARRRGIDTVINLEMFARFGSMLAYLTGAGRRAGFHAFGEQGLYCGDLLTHRVLYNPHVHTSEALFTIARSFEEPDDHVPMGKLPSIALPAIERVPADLVRRRYILDRIGKERPATVGKRLIVINPNASQLIPIRRWPLQSYAELVAALLTDPANACVLTGTASEAMDAQFISDRVKSERIVNLAGRTTVRDLLDLYSVADLLVTNDSGPAQLAALTDVHVLVFFGPETPKLYRPLAEPGRMTVLYSDYACSPCVSAFNQRTTDCNDNQCLKTIDVAAVHRAALIALANRRSAPA